MEDVTSRRVQLIIVTILHRAPCQAVTIDAATHNAQGYEELGATSAPVVGYEADVRCTNGDNIHATFRQRAGAVDFLMSFQ